MSEDRPAAGDYVVLLEGAPTPTRVLLTRVDAAGALRTVRATFPTSDAEQRLVAEALVMATRSGARTFHRTPDGTYSLVERTASSAHVR